MISIVDADELRNVLRPTVYRPNADEPRRGQAAPVEDRSAPKGEPTMKMIAGSAVAR
jgi:hypothetical protein